MVETKSEQVNIRLTPGDRARLKAKAESEGETVSGWVERTVLHELDAPAPSKRTDYKVDRAECAHKRLRAPKPRTNISRCPDCGTDVAIQGIEVEGAPVSRLGGRLVP